MKPALTLCALLILAPLSRACELHSLLGLPEPIGTWTLANYIPLSNEPVATPAITPADPAITAWKLATGAKAHSVNPQINTLVSNITADVDRVAYDASYAYVHSSDLPSHNVGPFPGNPAYPADKNQTFRIPRNPQPAVTHSNVGLGAVGVMVNGVDLFNALDAATYNNANTWHQIANVFEASSFDTGPGHPAPGQGAITPGTLSPGTYHYHQAPTGLINQIDPANTGQHHSAIIGFAFDGYPIYGSYGFANANGTGGITRESSSYQLRNITQRHTLPNGTLLPQAQWGPDVSATYPLGDYQEDYAYVAGAGTLDQYDGRFTVTPDYPAGTYAYFLPLDASLNNVYPYVLGPQYYGIVDTANLGGGAFTVPANATLFFSLAPEPTFLLALTPLLLLRRRPLLSSVF